MFKTARLKLTAFYLVIITIICLLFSLFTHKLLTDEVDRFARFQRNRIEEKIRFESNFPHPDIDLVDETKRRITFSLIIVNGVIIFVSGGLAYFLAGKTLGPIQVMIEDQHRFVADSSHEFRTPITSIKLATEVALRSKNISQEDIRNILGENLLEINKLQRLSDGMLRLAQYDSKGSTQSFQKLSIQKIATSALNQVAVLAASKQINIVNKIKNFHIAGVEADLNELLVILLDNAIKYSPEKTTIALSSQKIKKSVYLSIIDQGIGISKTDIPYIYERFYRSDKSRTGANGFGLGLSIAKRIINSHHGEIQVDSTLNKGTTFVLKFPVYNLA